MPEGVGSEAGLDFAYFAIHETANRIAYLGILAFAPTAFMINVPVANVPADNTDVPVSYRITWKFPHSFS